MKNMINRKLTMTSQEIADLVGSRHDSVKRTIGRLAGDGVIASPPVVEKPTAGRTAVHYLFEGERGQRDSIVVVAQVCPQFTGRLVDRWRELERQVELLSAEGRTIHHQHKVDVVALACAVAETTVTTAIKAAIEAATVQQKKLTSQRRDSDDFVVSDHPGVDSDIDNTAFLPVHALSAKSGLTDSACRRLIEFAHVPARKIGRSGLHADSDAFVAAARKLIGESELPKGGIKRWQHPEFGGFMLRRALPQAGQEKQD
ncbi:Rha family transcriptional regulator [Salmonella enterica]|nr:hypothetical protein [Salmonella enterica]EGL7480407.1 hypothetical protein [Salmonella enterica]EIZ2335993.1 Rha family transcriptional regulator [Salmonella enterica]